MWGNGARAGVRNWGLILGLSRLLILGLLSRLLRWGMRRGLSLLLHRLLRLRR